MRLNLTILVCLYLATFAFLPAVAICEPKVPVKLTNLEICFWPSISDDGTKIAFIAHLNIPKVVADEFVPYDYETAEIFVVNSDGSDLKQVTNSTAQGAIPVLACSISGDGSKIVFTGRADLKSANPRSGIFIVNSDGSELKHVTNYTSYSSPSISDDGSKVAFTTKSNGNSTDLFVVNSDGTGLRQLTSDSLEVIIPKISGDGSKIVFIQYSPNYDEYDLFVVNSDGAGLKQLTSNSVIESQHSISDDGSKIAFISRVSFGIGEVFVINSDGSGLKQWTSTTLISENLLVMSGDGSKILVSSVGDRGYRLSVVNSDGSEWYQFETDAVVWQVSLSYDGSKIVFVTEQTGLFIVAFDASSTESSRFNEYMVVLIVGGVAVLLLVVIFLRRKKFNPVEIKF